MKKYNLYFIGEIITISLTLIVILLSVFSDIFSNFFIPQWLFSSRSNFSDDIFNLFGIQATLATMSVAITALISGLINDSVYGITISHYISQLKPTILKHRNIIIINLCLTFLNYFLISLEFYNSSIAIFLVSIIIAIRLVYDVYIVFSGRKKVKEQIASYILKKYNVHIDDVSQQLFNSIDKKEFSVFQENLNLLENIYTKETSKDIEANQQFINKLDEIYNSILKKSIDKKDIDIGIASLNSICDIYNEVCSSEKNYSLDLWDNICMNFYNVISLIPVSKLLKDCKIHKFHDLILMNQKYDIKEDNYILKNGFEIQRFSYWLYNCSNLNEDKYLESGERLTKYLAAIIEDDFHKLDSEQDDNIKKIKTKLLFEELSLLFKAVVDKQDKNGLKQLFSTCDNINNKLISDSVFVILMIYLYYISKIEDLTQEPLKIFAKSFLTENRYIISNRLLDVNFSEIARNCDNIITFIWVWERSNSVITKTIDSIVIDFIIFCSLNAQNQLSEVLKAISNFESFFSLHTRFVYNKNEIIDTFKKFNEYFYEPSVGGEEYMLNELEELLLKLYKDYIIDESASNPITSDMECILKTNTKSNIINSMTENISVISSARKNHKNINKDNIVFSFYIGRYHFNFNNSYLINHRINDINKQLILKIIDLLKSENMNIKNLQKQDNNKQQTLIDLVHQSNISADTFIGSLRQYFSDSEPYLLEDFVREYKKVILPTHIKNMYIVDSKKIYIHVTNITVDITKLTEADIVKLCRISGPDIFEYNITNDIYIPFSKKQIMDYLDNTTRLLSINIEYEYKIDNSLIGVGVEII